jgi:hypothetical protein
MGGRGVSACGMRLRFKLFADSLDLFALFDMPAMVAKGAVVFYGDQPGRRRGMLN